MALTVSLRQIRRRIRSVENTQKITRAMEMVAAVKLRRFQDFLESSRPYTAALETLTRDLLRGLPEGYRHPFLEKPGSEDPAPKRKIFVLFTSDTGLCGTYNGNLEERARHEIRQAAGPEPALLFVGKHGANAFAKTRQQSLGLFSDLRVSRVDEILEGVRKTLAAAYFDTEDSEIWAVYTRAESLARYQPVAEKLLPISIENREQVNDLPSVFLVEPDPKTVLNRILPAYFEARLRLIFYHALFTEQIARMTAMRQATQNAKEMIEELTLLRNKARQAAITKEIIEVVSGSRAQKLK